MAPQYSAISHQLLVENYLWAKSIRPLIALRRKVLFAQKELPQSQFVAAVQNESSKWRIVV